MEILETIISRRSIRKYKHQTIDKEIIMDILNAAMYAPSARNEQPWQFIVIDKRDILNALAKIHPHAKMLLDAPMAILVCADENLEKTTGYWVQDCSAATQNILLSAHGFGIGTVWLGVYPREQRVNDLKELFNLPVNIQPLSLIALGYPAEEKETPERFKKNRIHFNNW